MLSLSISARDHLRPFGDGEHRPHLIERCRLHCCGLCALNGAGASLEIRLVRSREHVGLSGGVVRVCHAFGADIFHPCT